MPDFKTLDDADLNGKKVILRLDLNVPVDDNKHVTDTTRIDRARQTVLDILEKNPRQLLILSHYGRPKGTVNPDYSLDFIVGALKKSWGVDISLEQSAPAEFKSDEPIVLLENIRFYPGEETNDAAFAKELADMGEIYVNDAFSAAHRAHASTAGIAEYLPSYAGRLMQAELQALENALEAPKRPVTAIVGGAKVSTKLSVLGNLIHKVDNLILGGGMANTFLYAQGLSMGKSLHEADMKNTALDIMAQADEAGCKIFLPIDGLAAAEFKAGAANKPVLMTAIPDDMMVLDAGPKTTEALKSVINESATVLWNGPLGAFEIQPFDTATVALAKHVAEKTSDGDLISIAGGGDTVAALNQANVSDKFSYISTAGGAFLEWLEGKPLPGVDALKL